eukprot:UN27601
MKYTKNEFEYNKQCIKYKINHPYWLSPLERETRINKLSNNTKKVETPDSSKKSRQERYRRTVEQREREKRMREELEKRDRQQRENLKMVQNNLKAGKSVKVGKEITPAIKIEVKIPKKRVQSRRSKKRRKRKSNGWCNICG